MQGFVIVDPDGRPRMVPRHGRTSPFRLADLAAELRERFPMLFEPGTVVGEAAPNGTAPVSTGTVAPDETEPGRVGGSDGGRRDPGHRDRRRSWRRRPEERRSRAAAADHAVPADALGLCRLAAVGRSRAGLRRRWVRCADRQCAGSAGGRRAGRPAGRGGTVQTSCFRHSACHGSCHRSSPAPSAERSSVIAGVPEVVDTATLRLERRIVRLFGVEWDRGSNAEDLTRYIAARPVVCETGRRGGQAPVPDRRARSLRGGSPQRWRQGDRPMRRRSCGRPRRRRAPAASVSGRSGDASGPSPPGRGRTT